MTKILLSLVLLAVATTAADARTKPVRKPPGPATVAHLSYELCGFAAGATAPDWPAARQKMSLGNCPMRATPRRAM
jgi:hypothetical protein